MLTAPLYRPTEAELDALMAAYPFALVVSGSLPALEATPLPLFLEQDADGGRILVGHFARANPQVASLKADPRALVIFQGPHGYISPSWLRDRTQAPTWNFEMAQFQVEVEIRPGLEAAVDAVGRLTALMEADRPQGWAPAEMGERHLRLAQAVVAFRARVTAVNAKFKLGQNERLDVLEDILTGLDASRESDLALAMRLANHDRLSRLGDDPTVLEIQSRIQSQGPECEAPHVASDCRTS